MRVEPRRWWRPAHDRLADAWWILRGGESVITFPDRMTIDGGGFVVAGRRLRIELGRVVVVDGPAVRFRDAARMTVTGGAIVGDRIPPDDLIGGDVVSVAPSS